MYASDLIEELQKMIEAHGDLSVEIYNPNYDTYNAVDSVKYHVASQYNDGSFIEIVR